MTEPTRKELLKETLRIAIPAVLEGMLIVLIGMVDTYMVSTLGRAEVSAIGITAQPRLIVFTLFFSVNIAIGLLVARRKGENKQKEANTLFVTGLAYTIAAGIIVSILCVIFSREMVVIGGANEDSTEAATTYFRIVMGGSIFTLVSLYINAAQRGCGKTRISMTTNITSNVVNVILNYLLIGGKFGFPALGVRGAAIATVAGTFAAFVMSILSLFRKDGFISVKFIIRQKISNIPQHARTLARISVVILGELLLTRLGFILNSILAARLGTDPNAANHVGMSFMNIGFGFGDGLQIACIALVGRSIGQKNEALAKRYVWTAQKVGFIASSVMALIILIFGRSIYNLYFPDTEHMLLMGDVICMYIAVIMPVQVAKIIFSGSLRGGGDVKFILFGATISVTLIQPVITYVLAFVLDYGIQAVWFSILISQLIQLILYSVRFYRGNWINKKV